MFMFIILILAIEILKHALSLTKNDSHWHLKLILKIIVSDFKFDPESVLIGIFQKLKSEGSELNRDQFLKEGETLAAEVKSNYLQTLMLLSKSLVST